MKRYRFILTLGLILVLTVIMACSPAKQGTEEGSQSGEVSTVSDQPGTSVTAGTTPADEPVSLITGDDAGAGDEAPDDYDYQNTPDPSDDRPVDVILTGEEQALIDEMETERARLAEEIKKRTDAGEVDELWIEEVEAERERLAEIIGGILDGSSRMVDPPYEEEIIEWDGEILEINGTLWTIKINGKTYIVDTGGLDIEEIPSVGDMVSFSGSMPGGIIIVSELTITAYSDDSHPDDDEHHPDDDEYHPDDDEYHPDDGH